MKSVDQNLTNIIENINKDEFMKTFNSNDYEYEVKSIKQNLEGETLRVCSEILIRAKKKFALNLEGKIVQVKKECWTGKEIMEFANWDLSKGLELVCLKTGKTTAIGPDEKVCLKPGMGFGKRKLWKRGKEGGRFQQELCLLKEVYESVDYVEQGQWVLIKNFKLPEGWQPAIIDVAFKMPTQVGTKPYGIFVPIDLTFNGSKPNNFTVVKENIPFKGQWGILSWSPQQWQPGKTPNDGDSFKDFVFSFNKRFVEGV